MAETKKIYKRKEFWINKELQFSYMRLILIAVLSSALVSAITFGGGIYYLVRKAIAFRLPDVMEQKLTTDIIFSDINRFVLLWLPIVIIVLGVAFAIASVFMSHRFAGPLYRLNKWLVSLTEYDFSIPIKFRPKDELKVLEPPIEEVEKVLSKAINEDRVVVYKICSKIESIANKSNDADIKEVLSLSMALKEKMDRYKIHKEQ